MNKNIGFVVFVFIAVLAVFMSGSTVINLYIDWLFFHETGFPGVFTTVLANKIIAGILFGSVFLIFYLANIYFANKASFPLRDLHIFGDTIHPTRTFSMEKPVKWFTWLGGVFMAFLIGLFGASRWEDLLLYKNRIDVGMQDPVFSRDISFYMFTLPVIETFKAFLVLAVVVTVIAAAVSYFLRGGISVSERNISLHPAVRKHAGVFGVIISGVVALHFYTEAYKLLFLERGVIFGAGYTDIHARLFTFRLLSLLSLATGAAFIAASFRGSFKWILLPAAAAGLIYIGGIIIYIPFIQKFRVAPNELELETPFIEHNIRFTRFGYDLDRIELKTFDTDYDLDEKEIVKNDATIKNIRLWDNNPLLRTYSQLQQIRTYYKFTDVDNDRYTINGDYKQVMLSPRELSYSDLPSRSWINERLVFTHGNGLAMGPVNSITKEGLPEFIVKDIPPVTNADIRITRPEIYYGEIPNDYVIVKTKVQEFSYPTTTGNVYTRYDGRGGIELSSFFLRSIFAMRFNTAKIFLSTDITSESRILMYRGVRERISKIAPFLLYDSDPYMVISGDGKLYWMIDCYTVSRNLPYSTPVSRNINYIRNSVKAVIEAYDGTVDFYVSDAEDVLIKVYSRAFPGLFKPLQEMPADLRKHIRYPQGMLEVQAGMFASYHMTDPKVFYNKEDLWEIPSYSDKPMEPYNTIMKLPGEQKEEYILLIPYTPSKRDNLAAWMAARCDMPNYGKLIIYVFPRDRLVYGPRQVNARIDQDAYISQQITLWGQIGSQVIRGSLLIIPIENSLLYIQPLYLSASDKVGLPELRRVIVAYKNKVVMEENLELALQRLFAGVEAMPAVKEKPSEQVRVRPDNLEREALRIYERALQMQKSGDWAGYGEQLKKLENILREMAR
ncbi:MAG: UPF0182 family protein [Nitrospiraceae bacterium]|nr:MAG: UPF0182 family protein [Nitrospiraceae bacterium]